MKILVVSQYFYPEQFRINDVCFRLAEMGHEIVVLTGLPNYPEGKIFDGFDWASLHAVGKYDPKLDACCETHLGVQIIRCNLRPRLSGKKNLALNYVSFMKRGSKVAKKITTEFDKILVFQYSPVTMAIPAVKYQKQILKKAGDKPPLYLYCFDLWPESIVSAGLSNHGLIYTAVKMLSKWIYKKADKIFVSSKLFEKYFDQKLDISGNIQYLPIYAEDLFCHTTAANNNNDGDDDGDCVRLLFAGNIGEMQSVDTILRAAALLQDANAAVHIDIVGDGSSLDKCKSLSAELKLENVTFHGRYPLEAMPIFYNIADAFLITLKDDPFISYTLPNKVQPYMAAGKPLIASINGEVAELVTESNCGLVCPAEDHRSLAENILKFIAEKEKHSFYGTNASTYYDENFSADVFFSRLFSYMDEDKA